ncbi:rhodanese-like domain-containing protein [Orrella sp. JC864]|uniref:rhodanese-like domain-containing protein n=1 Tax=Orrella sp. JC864 TaxID=3120298 RepID=UPI0012BBF22E
MNPNRNIPFSFVTARTLKSWLDEAGEIALLDVREHGQYGEAHLFFGVNVPYSRLECEIGRLVPRKSVRVVVYDDGDGVAEQAAAALAREGYGDVHCLQGGAPAWKQAGYSLFAGVNVPSKTFGELAEHAFETPRIGARELAERLARKDDLVVLDGRPFTEFAKMSIPGATCCPNGELALRVHELVPSDRTTIVVNCAGRTRSIIGAQTLINLGLPNPVMALENGTQGWYLEDLALEHGAARRHGQGIDRAALNTLQARADALARRAGVARADAATVRQWLADPSRTTMLCDVRTPEEYAQGTLAGAQHTPGGQLIQATDQYVAVQGARLVLVDGEGVRAPVVASWLVQMGWEAVVLEGGVQADLAAAPRPPAQALADAPPAVALAELGDALAQGARLIDLRPSMQFRAGHIEGARWSIRPRLAALALAPQDPVVLIAPDAGVAALAARTLRELGIGALRWHAGTPEQWRQAGLPVVCTPQEPADEQCIDFLFFVHDRHDGNKQAARQYLAWETNLVHQIDPQERARFDFRLISNH